MSTAAWQYRQESDGIGILTLDVPERSANTLSIAVLEDLGRTGTPEQVPLATVATDLAQA